MTRQVTGDTLTPKCDAGNDSTSWMTTHSHILSLHAATYTQMHIFVYVVDHIWHTYTIHTFTELVSFRALISDAHIQKLSVSYTHIHIDTQAHKHHHIFQIRLFHGSFPPSSPLKMTVADISTHSEGKREDISSWVTKLGSNYIALSRQPWLLLTRPDIWSVSAG